MDGGLLVRLAVELGEEVDEFVGGREAEVLAVEGVGEVAVEAVAVPVEAGADGAVRLSVQNRRSTRHRENDIRPSR